MILQSTIADISHFPKMGVWIDVVYQKISARKLVSFHVQNEETSTQDLLDNGYYSVLYAHFLSIQDDFLRLAIEIEEQYPNHIKFFKRHNQFVWSLQEQGLNGDQVFMRFRVLSNPFISQDVNRFNVSTKKDLAETKVLLVELNDVSALVLRKQIEIIGPKVVRVYDYHHALQKLENERFEILLIDLHLPNLDAYLLAKKIRSSALPISKIPILGTTTSPRAEVQDLILEAGMNGIICKPFYPQQLKEILFQFVELK